MGGGEAVHATAGEKVIAIAALVIVPCAVALILAWWLDRR